MAGIPAQLHTWIPPLHDPSGGNILTTFTSYPCLVLLLVTVPAALRCHVSPGLLLSPQWECVPTNSFGLSAYDCS